MGYGTAGIERKTARLVAATAILSFATAALAGSTVILNNLRSDLNAQVQELEQEKDELRVDLDAANARVVSRDDDVRALREEVRELRLYAPAVVPSGGGHDIRMGATVTLAAGGDTIKLDSALPLFDIGPMTYEKNELSFDGRELRVYTAFGDGTDYVALSGGVADYETCAVAQGWSERSRFDPSELTKDNVCIRLDSGRYAVIRVVRFDKASIDFQATVWQ